MNEDFEARKVVLRKTTIGEFELRVSVNRITHDHDEIEIMEFEGDYAYSDAATWCSEHNYEIVE